MPATEDRPRTRPFGSLQWWIRDRDDRVVIVQPPNAAIIVWLAAALVGWTGALSHRHSATVAAAGRGALVVWGLDELVRGASPVRRLLGSVVLVGALAHLLR